MSPRFAFICAVSFLLLGKVEAESLYLASPDAGVKLFSLSTGASSMVNPNSGVQAIGVDSVNGDLFVSFSWAGRAMTYNATIKGSFVGGNGIYNSFAFTPSGGGRLFGNVVGNVLPTAEGIVRVNTAPPNTPSTVNFPVTAVSNAQAMVAADNGDLFIAGGSSPLKSIYLYREGFINPQVFIGTSAGLEQPTALAMDSLGNLYVSDMTLDQVLMFSAEGVLMATFGSSFGINNPMGIAFDSEDNLYISNAGTASILKITPLGVVSTFASGLVNPTQIVIGPDWVSPVPEPGTVMLFVMGATFVLILSRFRRRC
jgi:hypothetical protein